MDVICECPPSQVADNSTPTHSHVHASYGATFRDAAAEGTFGGGDSLGELTCKVEEEGRDEVMGALICHDRWGKHVSVMAK